MAPTTKRKTTRGSKNRTSRVAINDIALMMRELEFGLDVQAGSLYLTSDVSLDSLYETMSKMNFLKKMTSKKSLTINVSSFGGDVYSMFGIHDFIRMFPMPVNTVCIGTAMSAAAFLLTSGTGTRRMTTNSVVMFHQFTTVIEGKTHSAVSNAEHIKLMQNKANSLLAAYTKHSRSFWDKHGREDLFLTAEQCLEYGVVDELIDIK